MREELAGSDNRVVAKLATTARDGKTYQTEHYNLDIVQSYTGALDLLDDYDHLSVTQPKVTPSACEITYEECREVIDSLRFGRESTLFGVEKDGSFRGAIGNVFQSFGGHDVYPTLEEKAANLLYFVMKDHSFLDGNKRIAAAVLLYFLDRNNALFTSAGEKTIDDSALVAMTILIAESRPEEKGVMVALVMHFLKRV